MTFIKENEMNMLLAKTRLNVVITDIFYSIVLKSPTIFENILTLEMVMSKYVFPRNDIHLVTYLVSLYFSRAAVVRGQVITSSGMGLIGVRVSTTLPNEGFTMTREDGWFDLMVNGGGPVMLQFGRNPYPPLR